MSSVYDNWEKLVGAVMRRQKDRQLAYCESFSTSYSSDFSSRFSFDIGFPEDEKGGDVKAMEYEEIRRATKNFRRDHFMGQGQLTCFHKGRFARVYTGRFTYKGWFDENPAAVIKFDRYNINPQKWMEEISHLRHPNLVTPIGYCFNEDKTILVYEFMSEGSLYKHLFTRRQQQPLSWATRMKVARCAATGLAFLHSLSKPLIIRILGSANILLDNDFNAKLLDFGYKEEIPNEYMVDEVDDPFVRNANEYSAPEYRQAGIVSTKCDVYSFGVILVELITGRQAFDKNRPRTEIYLIYWAERFLRDKTRLLGIMDSRLEGQYPRKQAREIAQLALQCLSCHPESRPEMTEVVAALQRLEYPTT